MPSTLQHADIQHLARIASVIPPAIGIAEEPLTGPINAALVGGTSPLLEVLGLSSWGSHGEANGEEDRGD